MLTVYFTSIVDEVSTVAGSSLYNEEPMTATVTAEGQGLSSFLHGKMRATQIAAASTTSSSLERARFMSSTASAVSDIRCWFKMDHFYDPACMADNYFNGQPGYMMDPLTWYAMPLNRTILSAGGMWQQYETPQLYTSGMFFIGPVMTDSRLLVAISVAWYGDWDVNYHTEVRIRNNITDVELFRDTYTHDALLTATAYEQRVSTFIDIQADEENQLAIECLHDAPLARECGAWLDHYVIFRAIT